MSNGPRPPKLITDSLREGEIRALGYVTLLTGERWLKEIIAIRGQHLYCYHHEKRVYIVLNGTEGKEFKQIEYSPPTTVCRGGKTTWKLIGGKAIKS